MASLGGKLGLLLSVARKCVARHVRWVTLLQLADGQIKVLAPEDGTGFEQRVQLGGGDLLAGSRMARDLARRVFEGKCVTSRACMPLGAMFARFDSG